MDTEVLIVGAGPVGLTLQGPRRDDVQWRCAHST